MSNEFPAFIKAEYIEGDAFSRFQRDVSQTLAGTQQRFERSFAEIGNVISKAITRPVGAGKIDIGLPDFRQAAADARLYQTSIEATLGSAKTLAQLTGDVSAQTRSYIQALTAQNAEARQAVAAADAQVTTYTRLQTALNATADANSRLAQAQREVYAEQARAAQIEVQQRQRQQALNQVFAPGLSSRATDNGAGFGALDAMVRQQQQAAAAQQAYAASAAALRAELDPMFAAQQRFNTALDRADELLKAGAISTREYEQANAQARQQLQQHAQSLFQVEAAQGRGTTATRINTESQRANRFAMIQAGQQLQDIQVSLISGQRATTVFAQQLPQLAFAFTDVGGKVGQVAQFLAGPWGVAVFGAVTALGFLIENLITAGDESDDLGRASLTLSQALDKERLATEEGLQALKDFNAEKERARSADALAIDDSIRKADARRREALATREALQAELERQRALQDVSSSIDDSIRVRQPVIRRTEEAISENQRLIDELNKSLSNLGIDKATQDAKALADPIEAINQRYDRMTDFAKRASSANKILSGTLRDTLAGLEKQRQAEIDATRERERGSSSTRAPSLPPVTGTEVARILGAPITSGTRTAAQNRAVGGAPNSLHLVGQAIDIPLTVGGKPLTKAGIRSALESAGIKVREILGPGDKNHDDHFHVGFDRKRQRPDQVAGAAEREAEEAARVLEALASRVQNLQDRFDPATKAANDFAEALRTIKEAEGAGIISESQSFDLQIAAMAQQAGELTRIQNEAAERFMKVFEPQQMRSAAEEYADVLEERWSSAQSTAAGAFVRAVEGADLMEAIFSGRFRVNDLLRLVNPNDSRLATGAAASDTGLNRLLFGRTSNFREIAEGKPEIQGGLLQSYTKSMNDFQDAMQSALEAVFGPEAENFGGVIGNALAGAQVGQALGGKTGRGIGAAIGAVAGSEFMAAVSGPLALASQANQIIGDIFGFEGGPLGVFTGLLTKTSRGSATIGGSGSNLQVSSTRGNSRSRIEQSSGAATEAITTLERIAQALGGSIDASRGAVSIGVRDKNIRVDTSGRGATKTSKGAIDFGEDSAAAIKFATMDLISDGVIVGLRASTQRLLQNSKDLDAAIQKAVDFQSVFDRLQARIDPVGAAISGVEREFTRLRSIFGEAAASVEELADLEKLYALEREEAIKDANERVLGSMKALLDDLRFGDNGRSLRDRLAAAQAKFDPLAARVQAGDITAYDDFAEAARTLLDIQRQFSGSQTAFFELQDRITAITAKVVEGGNVTSILPGSSATAQADAQRAYDGSNVVSAIDRQTEELARILTQVVGGTLVAINDNVAGGPVSGGRVDIPGFFAQNVRQI